MGIQQARDANPRLVRGFGYRDTIVDATLQHCVLLCTIDGTNTFFINHDSASRVWYRTQILCHYCDHNATSIIAGHPTSLRLCQYHYKIAIHIRHVKYSTSAYDMLVSKNNWFLDELFATGCHENYMSLILENCNITSGCHFDTLCIIRQVVHEYLVDDLMKTIAYFYLMSTKVSMDEYEKYGCPLHGM